MQTPDFTLKPTGPVSELFLRKNIDQFVNAVFFVKNLPYSRNTNKSDILCPLLENRGTCSTKHALLKQLAIEQAFPELKLMLGIYRMSAKNTPAVGEVLHHYGLDYIPEAHNYLRYSDSVIDVTMPGIKVLKFQPDLMEEHEIKPSQVVDFKISYHQKFINNWLKENGIPYSLDKLWQIREQCIRELSTV